LSKISLSFPFSLCVLFIIIMSSISDIF
jgi:hypothetical protein